MKLEKIIKNKGQICLSLASALLLGGCETMTDNQLLGLALGGAAPYSKSPQSGQSMAFLGDALISSDNADRSRSVVNVVNNQSPNTEKYLDGVLIGKWIDYNGNDRIDINERNNISGNELYRKGSHVYFSLNRFVFGEEGEYKILLEYSDQKIPGEMRGKLNFVDSPKQAVYQISDFLLTISDMRRMDESTGKEIVPTGKQELIIKFFRGDEEFPKETKKIKIDFDN